MIHPTHSALFLAAVLAAAGVAGPVRAGPGPGRGAPPEVRELAAAGISLQQAVRKVRRRTGGRVLSAGVSKVGGNPVYRIKVLMPGGRVRVVLVDARTGEILD
jgi:hypothetical protein